MMLILKKLTYDELEERYVRVEAERDRLATRLKEVEQAAFKWFWHIPSDEGRLAAIMHRQWLLDDPEISRWADQVERVFYDPCQTCNPFGAGKCEGHLPLTSEEEK